MYNIIQVVSGLCVISIIFVFFYTDDNYCLNQLNSMINSFVLKVKGRYFEYFN